MKKAGIKAEVLNVSPPDIVPALARGDIDAEDVSIFTHRQRKPRLGLSGV